MIYMPSAFCLLPASASHLPLASRQAERPPKQKWNEASLACVPLLFGRLKEIASIWCRPLMNTLPMCKLQLRLNTYAGCPAVCPDSGNFRNIGTSQCQQGKRWTNFRLISNTRIFEQFVTFPSEPIDCGQSAVNNCIQFANQRVPTMPIMKCSPAQPFCSSLPSRLPSHFLVTRLIVLALVYEAIEVPSSRSSLSVSLYNQLKMRHCAAVEKIEILYTQNNKLGEKIK